MTPTLVAMILGVVAGVLTWRAVDEYDAPWWLSVMVGALAMVGTALTVMAIAGGMTA